MPRRYSSRISASQSRTIAFTEYLRGKSVVIVGPAAYLEGGARGPWIDSHDVVIRLNLGSPVPSDMYEDLGSRTDILYHTLFSDAHLGQIGKQHTLEEVQSWKDDGVKFLVTRQRRRSDRVNKILPFLNDVGVGIVYVPTIMQAEIRRACAASPNTGTIAIPHLLSTDLASLDVVGFDFYASGYYPGYGGFTREQAAKGGGRGVAYPAWGQIGPVREIHKQEGQLKYLASLVAKDTRLRYDDVASERLGLTPAGPMITALVPMKGHSERVPGKNARHFNGKPLFYRVLRTLLDSRRVYRVVVDTDSDELEGMVKEEFPQIEVIRRPQWLHGDHITSNELIKWELTQVEGEDFGQFHVTSPMLSPMTVDRAIGEYFDKPEYDSLFGVVEHHIWLFDKDGNAINSDPTKLIRSQDLDPLYEDNNTIHLFSRTSFGETGSRIGKSPQMFKMSKLESIDIDYEEDFIIAEAVSRATYA